MPSIIQIYVKAETRTRLKALAHLDNRSMAAYIEEMAKAAVKEISPRKYSEAVQAVMAGPDDSA